MDTPILHEAGDAGTLEIIPDSVRVLDAALNGRVASATTAAQLDAALREKLTVKRGLLALHPSNLEAAARTTLQTLSDRWRIPPSREQQRFTNHHRVTPAIASRMREPWHAEG